MSYFNSDGAAATTTTSGTVIVPAGSGLSIDTNGNLSNSGVVSVNGSTGVITGVITTGSAGVITGAMIANNTITNANLVNSSVTVGNTSITLGGNSTTLSGLTSVTSNSFSGALTGNVTGNVSGNSGTVTNGIYTTDTGTVTNTMLSGSITNTKLLNSSLTVNGVAITLGGSGTVAASASTLTGNTLASNILTCSLTSVGTLANLIVGPGTITKEPIQILAGPVQTSGLTAGDLEYDGDAMYFTPSGTQRGIVKTPQIFVLQSNYPLINQASTQSIFGKGVTLTGGTRYYYRILFTVYLSNNSRSSGALQYAIAVSNGALLEQHTYWVNPCGNVAQTTPTITYQMSNHITAGFNNMVSITNTTSSKGYFSVIIDGNIDCTTTGTITPQIGLSTSTPGSSSYTQAGATMEIYPISASGANTIVGTWA